MTTTIEKQTHQAPTKPAQETNFLLPAVNIFEVKDAYVIEAEMPGVTREGLDILLEEHTLTLTGRRNLQPPTGSPIYVETKPVNFRRVFEIEPTVDSGKITAHMDQGLLTVTLPKAERVKPRKIVVTD